MHLFIFNLSKVCKLKIENFVFILTIRTGRRSKKRTIPFEPIKSFVTFMQASVRHVPEQERTNTKIIFIFHNFYNYE